MIDSKTTILIDLLKPAVEAEGFELLGCEFNPSDTHSLLRVYIDHNDGITLDNCEKVSKQLAAILDVNDPIAGRYRLEVTSPGVERPLFTLEHYKVQIGKPIYVQLWQPLEKKSRFKGILHSITENDDIILDVAGNNQEIPFSLIKKAHLIYTFNEGKR